MSLNDLLTGYGGQIWPLPSIAGTFRGRKLIVCADASCVWADLESFGARHNHGRGSVKKDGWDILTINKVVETLPGDIQHAYSNEAHLLNKFIEARRSEYKREFSGPASTHSCTKGADYRWPWHGRGSSLLGGTIVGLALGYDQIVICGGPLDDGPHNGEPPWRKAAFTQECRDHSHWERAITAALKGKVTSMSGRTMKWLGMPSLSTSTAQVIS